MYAKMKPVFLYIVKVYIFTIIEERAALKKLAAAQVKVK